MNTVTVYISLLQGEDEPVVMIYAWWHGEFKIVALKPLSELTLND
jgi:hypothetical protein